MLELLLVLFELKMEEGFKRQSTILRESEKPEAQRSLRALTERISLEKPRTFCS